MSVTAGFMLPHPPLIVPEVGRGQEREIARTVRNYEKAAQEIAQCRPDTIVVLSPHLVMYADYFHISPGAGARGDFRRFGAGEVSKEVVYDREFVKELCREAKEQRFPAGVQGEQEKWLDHGTMVPLYFADKYLKDYKIIRIGLSGMSLAEHYRLGQMIQKTAEKLDRKTVIIASGDLSHRLKASGPYGFAGEGPQYDERVMDVMRRGAFDELFSFTDSFCEKAAECGHRSFVIMAGALDGRAVRAERLSHEGTFGVGYGICTFHVAGTDPERNFLQKYEIQQRASAEAKRASEDPYTALARRSLEYYIHSGKVMEVPDTLPDEMLQEQAGVFVSLHKDGSLRGCIGTISAVHENIAAEIIHNAVSAGTRDPRFDEVGERELDFLEYSVDVLGSAEAIEDKSRLDVKRYGVIVSKGRKRGLLLPNLDGVDTVDAQIAIAKRKAGISDMEQDVKLERFEVVRHGEK